MAAAKEKKKASEKQGQGAVRAGKQDRLDTKGWAGVDVRDITSHSQPSTVKAIANVVTTSRGAKPDVLGPRLIIQQNEAGKFPFSSRPTAGTVSSPVVRGPSPIDVRPSATMDKPKPELASKSTRESKVDPDTVKGIERFLKLHYLRSRPYNVCMEILYGRDTSPGTCLCSAAGGEQSERITNLDPQTRSCISTSQATAA